MSETTPFTEAQEARITELVGLALDQIAARLEEDYTLPDSVTGEVD
jgi:hypothetical protein